MATKGGEHEVCTCGERDKTKPFKVAVISAGFGGLSAACNLACRGFEVHVYDKMPEPGGMVAFGISEWRIPIKSGREGVKEIEKLGVVFHMRTKVVYDSPEELGDEWAERFISLEKLMNEFDAILIATGAWRPRILRTPGHDLPGVMDALSTLVRIKIVRIGYLPESELSDFEGKKVIVVGAGYTAVDMAKEAQLLGAREVTIAYRRSLEHSYAKAEIKKLINKGVKFIEYVTPERVIGDERVREVEFAKTKIVGGSVIKTDGRVTIPADYLMFAIGQIPTNPIREITCANEEILKDSGIFLAGDGISPGT
ncbi:FAD-dependent oxidoreductase [Pyrococcus kukulkanii]|uniref:FAD-dependent oxidoreductase n=1 Tax=Pyrococcus kukulkanii TaxID=1609559 RepID=UPI003565AF9C